MDDKEKVVTEATSPEEEVALSPEMEEELSNGKGEE